jgi:hypothetical protein
MRHQQFDSAPGGAEYQMYRSVEQYIRERAKNELHTLVSKGCDQTLLLLLLTLGTSFEAERDPWESLTGFSRRNFKSVLQRMRECAHNIKRLQAHPLAQMALHHAEGTSSGPYTHLLVLPKVLSAYADILDGLAKILPRGKRLPSTHVLAVLVLYVKDSTGHYHDMELSALVAGGLRPEGYSGEALKVWRNGNRDLIASIQRGFYPALLRSVLALISPST